MTTANKRAGGCFLTGALLFGFLAGLATGNAIRGAWLGLAVGIIIAVGLWIADRKSD